MEREWDVLKQAMGRRTEQTLMFEATLLQAHSRVTGLFWTGYTGAQKQALSLGPTDSLRFYRD